MNFSVTGEDYKKKKALPPKLQVEFYDNPPTIGEIHHNQIFKFVDNFKKFSATNNKVSTSSWVNNIVYRNCNLE